MAEQLANGLATRDAIDRLSETSLFDSEVSESPVEVPKADGGEGASSPKPSSESSNDTDKRLADFDERFRVQEQQLAYMRGKLSQQEAPAPKVEEPTPYKFNKDEFAAALEKDPAQAIRDLVEGISTDKSRSAAKEVRTDVETRIAGRERTEQFRAAYNTDIQEARKEFGDVLNDPDFQKEADKELQRIITARGGKTLQDTLPGDVSAVAGIVAFRWSKAGKLKAEAKAEAEAPRRSLRELIETVPRSDSVGSGNDGRGGSRGGLSFEKVYSSERDRSAARKAMRGFGLDPDKAEDLKEWMQNVAGAAKDDDSFGN